MCVCFVVVVLVCLFVVFSITPTRSQLQVKMHIKDGKASLIHTYTPFYLSYWKTLTLSIFHVRDYYSLPTIPSSWLSCMLTGQSCAIALVQQSAICVCIWVYVCVWEKKNTIYCVCFYCMCERWDLFCIYMSKSVWDMRKVTIFFSVCVCVRVCVCSTWQVFVVDTCSSSSADHLSMAPHLGRETALSSLAHTYTHAHTRVHTHTGAKGYLGSLEQNHTRKRGKRHIGSRETGAGRRVYFLREERKLVYQNKR